MPLIGGNNYPIRLEARNIRASWGVIKLGSIEQHSCILVRTGQSIRRSRRMTYIKSTTPSMGDFQNGIYSVHLIPDGNFDEFLLSTRMMWGTIPLHGYQTCSALSLR